MARTGVTLEMISADRGWASRAIRERLSRMRVKRVSISRSEGKAITLEGEWTSNPYE